MSGTGPLVNIYDAIARMPRYTQEASDAVQDLEVCVSDLREKATMSSSISVTLEELDAVQDFEAYVCDLRKKADMSNSTGMTLAELDAFHESVYHVLNRVTTIGVAWRLIAYFQGWTSNGK